jgi:Rrf2 family nitric oxide-sensitive transcriptional repressor
MILTKYADYSVRVLLYLGARPGQKVPITEIADAYGISRNHLMKVSQNLAHHRFIIGYRGKGGGISLARPARNIILGDVLALVEPALREPNIASGPMLQPADMRFVEALGIARKAFLDSLSSCTLADLLGAGSPSLAFRGTGNDR